VLRGAAFNEEFQGESLKTLFTIIKKTMPRDAPSSLSDETYLDIVAYVLKMNGYPEGPATLTTASLENIQVVAQPGADEIANYSMVRVIGCMTAGAGSSWTLTRATNPVKTRNPDASPIAELSRFRSTPLGNGTFGLVDTATLKPDSMKAHKVEAKGFLMRQSGGDSLSLTSLQSVSEDCSR
jgi:hypothetical protein